MRVDRCPTGTQHSSLPVPTELGRSRGALVPSPHRNALWPADLFAKPASMPIPRHQPVKALGQGARRHGTGPDAHGSLPSWASLVPPSYKPNSETPSHPSLLRGSAVALSFPSLQCHPFSPHSHSYFYPSLPSSLPKAVHTSLHRSLTSRSSHTQSKRGFPCHFELDRATTADVLRRPASVPPVQNEVRARGSAGKITKPSDKNPERCPSLSTQTIAAGLYMRRVPPRPIT